MALTAQDIADQINRLKPGQQIDISIRDIRDIKTCYLEYRTPMELILEKVYGSAVGVIEWWEDIEKRHITFRKTFVDEPCPNCGSTDIRTGKGNMFCNACGFFPIQYKEKLNERTTTERNIREPDGVFSRNVPRSINVKRTYGCNDDKDDDAGYITLTRKGTWTW
jgi:hypothetical protein